MIQDLTFRVRFCILLPNQKQTKKTEVMKTRNFIKWELVKMHTKVRTDKYGQVSVHNFTPCLFGDREEEVRQYCEENEGVLRFRTYGSRYGTFTAFSIEDAEIRKACDQALQMNEHYIRNMTSW